MNTNLLAVQNADVLRAVAHRMPDRTIKSLAVEVGRDDSNLSKTLKLLREAKLIVEHDLALTMDGEAMLPRLDVLEGRTVPPDGFVALQLHELAPHPLNPRKSYDNEALDELRQDILQSGGITSSLLVRPIGDGDDTTNAGMSARFWIVAGERRFRAVRLAIEDGDLPGDFRLPCQVREMTDAEHLRLSIGENIQRVDLDHVELGQQFEALLLTGEDTPKSIAERLSKTPEYVQQHVRILRLPPEQLAEVKSGALTFKQALDLVAKPKGKEEPTAELDLGAAPARLPPERELAAALAAHGQARLVSPPPEPAPDAPASYGTASGRGETPRAPAPEPARASFDPSPKMRLILLEIAAKVAACPMARFREGYTPVEQVPAGGAGPELVRARAIGFRSIGGVDEVRIEPRGPGPEWLDRIGWDRDDAVGRRGRTGDAAIDAGISLDRARPAYDGTGYLTDWLNVPTSPQQNSPGAAQAPAGDGRPLPETNAPPPLPAKPQSVGSIDADAIDERAYALAEAWTGTAYRFPPTSPSLPKEEDFRAILTDLGIELPLRAQDGVIFDARGSCFAVCDDDRLEGPAGEAFAHLIRIALHVCSGEAAQKAID